MTDSDEEISISQNSKNHTGMRKSSTRPALERNFYKRPPLE